MIRNISFFYSTLLYYNTSCLFYFISYHINQSNHTQQLMTTTQVSLQVFIVLIKTPTLYQHSQLPIYLNSSMLVWILLLSQHYNQLQFQPIIPSPTTINTDVKLYLILKGCHARQSKITSNCYTLCIQVVKVMQDPELTVFLNTNTLLL